MTDIKGVLVFLFVLLTHAEVLLLAAADEQPSALPDFEPRHFYEARMEPEGGVLHGAGQGQDEFADYWELALGNGTPPALYMNYKSLKGGLLNSDWIDVYRRAVNHGPYHLLPQCGIAMGQDGHPEEHYEHDVAAGIYDPVLHELGRRIRMRGHPVFLRVGYECNGPWNGYQPEPYKAAFRRVAKILRAYSEHAVLVWNVEAGFLDRAMQYYPGDDVVDWWSIDLFTPSHIEKCQWFLDLAHEHGKPVMIGESTPRRIGVLEGIPNWNEWFVPYFSLIRTNPGIKAFCYINVDWSKTEAYADWGDSRVQVNDGVRELFLEELRQPFYLHAAPAGQHWQGASPPQGEP